MKKFRTAALPWMALAVTLVVVIVYMNVGKG